MNKILTILALLLMLTSSFALTVEGEERIELCQCETEPLTFEVCADTIGTYNVSLEGTGAKWLEIAPKDFSLNPGECELIYAFVTPECYATSGTFPVTMKVNGIDQEAEKRFNVVVEQCHTFNYKVTPLSNISKPCESNYFDLYVKNTGKFVDEFVLNQTGVNDAWVNYPREPFVLKSGEELNTVLELKSECSANAGNYNFDLKLANTKTNASAEKDLLQTLVNFNPLVNNLSSNLNVCSEVGQEVYVGITNNSDKQDEVSLSISDKDYLSLSEAALTIDANQTKYITLKVAPTDPKDANFDFIMYSKNYDKTSLVNVDLEIEDCYNIDLKRKESQNTYCVGNNTQSYTIENKGTKEVTANIFIDGINVEDKNITIAPGIEKEVNFSFAVNEGDRDILVTAQTDYFKDTLEYGLTFEKCYGANLQVSNIEACANTQTTRTVVVGNTGTKTQNYKLNTNASWIDLSDTNISLGPNTEKEIVLSLDIPQNTNTSYTITAESENIQIARDFSVLLLPESTCYGFTVEKTNGPIDVNCCDGEISEMIIKNTGEFTQSLELEKIAPEWVSFSHTQLTINPSEERKVYVYFSPPAGTNGDILAQIIITNNKNISKTIDFNLNVFGGNCGVGLQAGVDVNNDVTLTKIFTRKEIDVEFVVKNDSNVGFNVTDMIIKEYPGSEVDFQEGIFLSPGQSTKARVTFSFLEDQEPQDQNIEILVTTSVGEFEKSQFISFSGENLVYDEIAITGFFTQFAAPLAGVLLLILILVIIVVVASKGKTTKRKKK